MTDLNVFTSSDPVLVDCIRFCFMPLIRKEFNQEWNSHIISKSRNSGPRGRPDVMYYLPHLYHSTDCLINVDADEIEQFYPCVTHNTVEDVSPEFKEFAQTLMQQNGWDFPNVVSDALRLYMYLLSKIEQYSQNIVNCLNFFFNPYLVLRVISKYETDPFILQFSQIFIQLIKKTQ